MHRSIVNGLLGAVLLLAPAACVSHAAPQPSEGPSTSQGTGTGTTFDVDVRGSVTYLASDDLEGRGVGTPGLDKAADFVASTFEKLGLSPPSGHDGYFQPFKMTTAVRPSEATALRLAPDGDGAASATPYLMGEDFVPLSFSAEKEFEGPLVFVGYGIKDAERKYDDFEGVDLKGKVAVAMRYEPHDAQGRSRFSGTDQWSPAATLGRKAKAAAEAGAAALVLINPPTHHEDEDPLVPFSRTFGGEHAGIPVVQVRRRIVDEWLDRAGVAEDLKALQAKIDDGGEPHSVALPQELRLSGDVEIDRVQSEVKNVLAVLPGKGPLAEEYVVIGAHYDHLGRGGHGSLNPASRDVHNGADDNASGTAAMLEVAEHFARRGSPGRSILFAAFTGEEMGLIGSNHFVNHPAVPLDRIAYMLNLDMVGRVRGDTIMVGGGGTAPSFEKILADADAASKLQLKNFGKGGTGPSDHMSFALKKIPVLFFYSGAHPDYHRPTDDAEKVNYDGIDAVVGLTKAVAEKLLAQPREQYVDAADAHGMFGGASGSGSGSGSGGGGFRASLGVIPDYAAEDVDGVRISGASPGSAAAKAGLKEGDVLVRWGQAKLGSVYDLTDELKKAKPGEKVKIGLLREGRPMEVEATLAEPRR